MRRLEQTNNELAEEIQQLRATTSDLQERLNDAESLNEFIEQQTKKLKAEHAAKIEELEKGINSMRFVNEKRCAILEEQLMKQEKFASQWREMKEVAERDLHAERQARTELSMKIEERRQDHENELR